MQSLRSKIFICLIRNRHLFKLKLKPELIDENFSVEDFRSDIDRFTAKLQLPKDIKITKTKIGNIEAEYVIPNNSIDGKILLYIHGGGFISGSCQTHRMHVAKFAKGAALTALLFNYRLAPEYPFPAAVEDCVEAYKWLLSNGYTHDDIIVGGESAGATLTLSLLLALKGLNIELPKAAFVISPVTDLRCNADSFIKNAKKDIAPIGSWDVWTKYYIADNDPVTPLLSPQFGNYEGLPPLFICVGTHEIHFDDCVNLARKAKEHGVNVTLSVWEKMIHAFPLLSPFFPEAKKAMGEICNFVKVNISLNYPKTKRG